MIDNTKGIDHNWVLNTKGNISVPCVKLLSKKTGILLSVYTNEPGIQIYSDNVLFIALMSGGIPLKILKISRSINGLDFTRGNLLFFEFATILLRKLDYY